MEKQSLGEGKADYKKLKLATFNKSCCCNKVAVMCNEVAAVTYTQPTICVPMRNSQSALTSTKTNWWTIEVEVQEDPCRLKGQQHSVDVLKRSPAWYRVVYGFCDCARTVTDSTRRKASTQCLRLRMRLIYVFRVALVATLPVAPRRLPSEINAQALLWTKWA